MGKRKFVGVQYVETVRVGNKTFAFGIYGDHKVGRVPFAGLALRNPSDKEAPSRGRNLAIARAFETLGKQIEKREWAKIKHPKIAVNAKKLSPEEVNKLKAAGKEVREARIKARQNDKAKTSKPTNKENIKVSQAKSGV